MGIMSFLRNRMGVILVVLIGFALFAFIAGEVIQYGKSFFQGDRNSLGEVGGQTISYEDFNQRVDQNTRNFQQYGQAITPQITAYAQNLAWNQMVSEIIVKKEVERLGIVVGNDETKAMVSGANPDPEVARNFTNPQTGKLDRNLLNQFLSGVASAPASDQRKQMWNDFLISRIEAKKQQKYVDIVQNGLYVNSLDANDDYEAKNKLANFKYVSLDYSTIPDNKVTATDDDYKSYYDEHKYLFNNPEETRSFDYVTFNAAPSKADTAAVKTQAQKLAEDFKASKDDSAFVAINSNNKNPLVFQKKGQLEPQLDSVMFNQSKGFVFGPYLSGNSFKVSKLLDEQVGPDSVKARHILIDITAAGGPQKALAKADSLKKLIQGGKSFAELAKTYSIDKGSAEKGGELGTFGRGAMVPAFEDAVFNGKKGDLKVVTSQYGVHLIEIEDQKGSSKVVKVATVDRPIQASSETTSAAYAKAQSFLSAASGGNFEAEAQKEKLQIKTATDVSGIQGALPGLDNAREIVRWAFKADQGDMADKAFSAGDYFVVPHLTVIKPKGQLSLDVVKKQIAGAVLNRVKAKQLTDKLQSALNGSSSIDQVAQKAGSKVVPVQNVVFANPILPGVEQENKLIGSVFGSQVHKLGKPVEGQHGVYAYEVDSFMNPAPLANAVREREQIGTALLQRAETLMLEALKDKANVKDNRAKFL